MKITVLGLGHLGAVAAGGLASAGHDVTGLDTDHRKVEELRSGRISIYEPGLQECLVSCIDSGNLRFSNLDDFTGPVGQVAMVAAGTPAMPSGEADLAQVRSALSWIKTHKLVGLTVVMKSTVPPGSGADFLRRDFDGSSAHYVSNPEFLREGRALRDWHFPNRIVLGTEEPHSWGIEAVKNMYAGVEAPTLVTDVTSAEMIKYASNAFLATRISFINEMASLCEAIGASIDEVSAALALDGRTGKKIYAGVGYGGSCLPKDIQALKHLAGAYGLKLDLLDAVTAVNNRQRALPLEKLLSRFGGDLRGTEVGVLGLAFKPGTDDVRGAVSLDVINSLVVQGARVRVYDPRASEGARQLLPGCVEIEDTPEEAARGTQALLVLTEWTEIVNADWQQMAGLMAPPMFLIDGRNTLDAQAMDSLGFEYMGIGRGHSSLQQTDQARHGMDVSAKSGHFTPSRSIRHESVEGGEYLYE